MSLSIAVRPRSSVPTGRVSAPTAGAFRIPSGLVRAVVAIAAAILLLPQLDSFGASLATLATADLPWIAAGVGLVALRYVVAAVSLRAAVSTPIPFGPTLLVQLASAFVGRLTPEGVGWLVLNGRYLERVGGGRARAVAAISLKVLIGALTRLAIVVVVAALAASTNLVRIDVGDVPPSVFIAASALAAALFVLVLAVRQRYPGSARLVRETAYELRTVVREPRRMAVLVVASGGLTVLSGLVLLASVASVGAREPVLAVFAVYLGGTALAALSPTPGNLGAVEVTLTAGLVALGTEPSAALAAVLLYRLLTFWLPVVPGFLALRHLHARGAL